MDEPLLRDRHPLCNTPGQGVLGNIFEFPPNWMKQVQPGMNCSHQEGSCYACSGGNQAQPCACRGD